MDLTAFDDFWVHTPGRTALPVRIPGVGTWAPIPSGTYDLFIAGSAWRAPAEPQPILDPNGVRIGTAAATLADTTLPEAAGLWLVCSFFGKSGDLLLDWFQVTQAHGDDRLSIQVRLVDETDLASAVVPVPWDDDEDEADVPVEVEAK